MSDVHTNYKEYLESYAWKALKKTKLEEQSQCESCWLPATSVHHLSYERLWREKSDDIVSICERCHEECHHVGGYQIKNDEEMLRRRFEEVKNGFLENKNVDKKEEELRWIGWSLELWESYNRSRKASIYVDKTTWMCSIDGLVFMYYLEYSNQLSLCHYKKLTLKNDLFEWDKISLALTINQKWNIPPDSFIKYGIFISRYNRGNFIKTWLWEILKAEIIISTNYFNIWKLELFTVLLLMAYFDIRFCSIELQKLLSLEGIMNINDLPAQESLDNHRKELFDLLKQGWVFWNNEDDLFWIIYDLGYVGENEGKYDYERWFVSLKYKIYLDDKLWIKYFYAWLSDSDYFSNLIATNFNFDEYDCETLF